MIIPDNARLFQSGGLLGGLGAADGWRLNYVRPGEKLSSAVGFGNCIALCVLAFLLGRRWSVARALRFSLRPRRFGQRRGTAAKHMG